MEEALDLRIHNRRSSLDEGIISFPTTYYSSRVQLLLTYKAAVEEKDGGGDLVIVEADTSKETSRDHNQYHDHHDRHLHDNRHNHHNDHHNRHDNRDNHGGVVLTSPSPSPGARSYSDTDTDNKGSSPYYLQSSGQSGQGRSNSNASSASLMDHDLLSTDDAQNPSSRSNKYTSKHVPNVDRMLKPTRLMCFLCDQKAKNGKTLETHIQKSHYVQTAQGRFLCCTECGYKYDSVEQLKSHFESSHSAKKGGDTKVKAYYPCSHCSRMYRKQSLLDAHMRLVNQKDTWKKNNTNNLNHT